MSYEFIASPNNYARSNTSIDGIILHFTGGGDIEGTIKWLCHTESKASAHYVVSRSGRIVQLVKEDRAAWHAGSTTTVPKLNGRKNLNNWTIGIEICNWGWLYEPNLDEIVEFNGKTYKRNTREKYVRNKKWTTPYIGLEPKEYIISLEESKALQYNKQFKNWPGGDIYYWEPYNENQMEAIRELISDIITRYPHITKEWIATHADVDPTRKLDMVGNIFNLECILNYIWPKKEEIKEFKIGRRQDDNATFEEMKEMYEPRKENKSSWCF